MKANHRIIVVAGPTASGKSDFAVELALQNNGEIISADSRQIYKGLDIGTGKITQKEMKGIPHHMLNISNLTDTFSVAEYEHYAVPILNEILTRGKTPIICGGTGQYIDALIYNQEIPKVKPNQQLRKKLEEKRTEELYDELLTKDSERATTIDRHNRVRLIRALEIIDTLGKVPIHKNPKLNYKTTFYLLKPTRELLRERITKRLLTRLTLGMIDEVDNLQQQGYTSFTMKKFGLEYVTIAKYLEGLITEEEMKEEIITKSMQYAKRQQTWNRKYESIAEIISL